MPKLLLSQNQNTMVLEETAKNVIIIGQNPKFGHIFRLVIILQVYESGGAKNL